MYVLDGLISDHKLMHLLFRSFERQMALMEETGRLNVDLTKDILDLIHSFVVGLHMAKEERHLVPKLLVAGVPRSYGPLLLLGQDHARIHDNLAQLCDIFEGLYEGDASKKMPFAKLAVPLINHLRLHMHREENSIYCLAEAIFGDEDWAELAEAFAHADRVYGGEERLKETEERMLKIAGQFDLALHKGEIVSKSLSKSGVQRGDFVVKVYQPK